MEKFQIELTKEEINVVKNGLGLVLLLDKKNSLGMSLATKQWYAEVANKFEKITKKEDIK